MKVLLIRHAIAMDREEFEGSDDLLRPLTKKGKEKAKEFFEKISKIYDIDVIISSKATRAIQTAQILLPFFEGIEYKKTPLLNPGASYYDYEKVIKEHKKHNTIALVGHEPDITMAFAKMVGCKFLNIAVKKASVIEIEESNNSMELRAMLYPKLLKNLNL